MKVEDIIQIWQIIEDRKLWRTKNLLNLVKNIESSSKYEERRKQYKLFCFRLIPFETLTVEFTSQMSSLENKDPEVKQTPKEAIKQ